MRIRQVVFVLAAVATSDAMAQEAMAQQTKAQETQETAAKAAKGVVTLPGVHASATPGCVEHNAGDGTTLSYACLNQLVATDVSPVPMPGDTDISKRPSNTIGLYNANSLSHRMGPNLGTSVQPYRPKLTYPTPLATKPP